MIKIYLSRILEEFRKTQSELPEKTDIRTATINEYYHELVERVNLDYLSRICEVLGCDIADLLEYVPEELPKLWRRDEQCFKGSVPLLNHRKSREYFDYFLTTLTTK